jgi:beta-aspartyl-peptidase (threonine type)
MNLIQRTSNVRAVIVHGGAWDIPNDLVDAHREACLAAVRAAWAALRTGGTALDAVEGAIVEMENHPDLDAGVGSFLNADGEVELDAGLMDGTTLKVGSIAAARRIRHPIRLARAVMESEHVLLVASGAEQFAREKGVERCPSARLVVPRELERWETIRAGGVYDVRQAFIDADKGEADRDVPDLVPPGDTVGAVALDARGNIAAGTSTGGTPFKRPGRVGDSPLVGCGYYADSKWGGVSCTGWGEGIMRLVLAKATVDRMARPSLRTAGRADRAARWAVDHLARIDGLGGVILLDHQGNVGCAFNTPRMAYAYMREGLEAPVFGIESS